MRAKALSVMTALLFTLVIPSTALELYVEPVEGYRNTYYGQRIVTDGSLSNDIVIVGEGKTTVFKGIAHLNCENGKYFWYLWDNYYSNHASGNEPNIPTQVMTAAFVNFC